MYNIKKITILTLLLFLLISCGNKLKLTSKECEYKEITSYKYIEKILYNENGLNLRIIDDKYLSFTNGIEKELKSLSDIYKYESYYYGLDNNGKYFLYKVNYNNIRGKNEITYAFSKDKKHFAFNVFDSNLKKWIFVVDGVIIEEKYYNKFDFDENGYLIILPNLTGGILLKNNKPITDNIGIVNFKYSENKNTLVYVTNIIGSGIYNVYVNGKKINGNFDYINNVAISANGNKIALKINKLKEKQSIIELTCK